MTEIRDSLEDEIKHKLDIVDLDLKGILKSKLQGSYIAGGALVSIILKKKVHDYDYWFESELYFNQALIDLQPVFDGLNPALTILADTDRAVTFMDESKRKFQFIRSTFGSAEDVVDHFDFKHTRAFYIPSENRLSYDEELILSKRLEFQFMRSPIGTFTRLSKFAKRGYTIKPSEIKKMLEAVTGSDAVPLEEDYCESSQ